MEFKSANKYLLKDGEVVIFPTDTVYGVGCKIYDNKAINRIYKIKKRDLSKQLAVLCYDISCVSEIATLDERALKLAKAFWPGALTMVLKTTPSFYKQTNYKTIGIRIPNHPVALKLLKDNKALATTSVNPSGEKPLTDIVMIKEKYFEQVDFILEDETNNSLKVSSTTIDLTNKEIKYIRVGTITKTDIEKILNKK